MGGFSPQVQANQTSGNGKVASMQQPIGTGQKTNSATSGQPQVGAPNQYPNTVGQWDNTQQQPQQPYNVFAGKGKG